MSTYALKQENARYRNGTALMTRSNIWENRGKAMVSKSGICSKLFAQDLLPVSIKTNRVALPQ